MKAISGKGDGLSHYTISEIARLCETSPATVSRVLNNPDIVAEPLRSRIRSKMDELDYHPNPFASRLSSRSDWGLALFVFDILNPFFALIVRRISHLALERGIPLNVCDTENNEEKESIYLDYLLKNKIGGVIFGEGISGSTIERAMKHTRTVLIDRHMGEGSISEVTSDNYLGGCQAVEFLLRLQHQRIGFIGGPANWASAEERQRGYRDTLVKNGIPYDESLVYQGNLRFESGITALEYFQTLSEWPTAIFSANDQMAFGALSRAKTMGISIPGDMSLVGFDNIESYSLHSTRLTAIQQDIDALCEQAFNIMMALLEDDSNETRAYERVLIPTRLKIGETCGMCSSR